MDHIAFSRKGGKARSAKKTAANRAKAIAYWNAVRVGKHPAPRHLRMPPTLETIAQKLAPYCRQAGITRLEIFGSIARGDGKRGSDVDLIATFAQTQNPGLRFFTMETEISEILGTPVHLLTRDSVEQMTNPYRRASILAAAKEIYRS